MKQVYVFALNCVMFTISRIRCKGHLGAGIKGVDKHVQHP